MPHALRRGFSPSLRRPPSYRVKSVSKHAGISDGDDEVAKLPMGSHQSLHCLQPCVLEVVAHDLPKLVYHHPEPFHIFEPCYYQKALCDQTKRDAFVPMSSRAPSRPPSWGRRRISGQRAPRCPQTRRGSSACSPGVSGRAVRRCPCRPEEAPPASGAT